MFFLNDYTDRFSFVFLPFLDERTCDVDPVDVSESADVTSLGDNATSVGDDVTSVCDDVDDVATPSSAYSVLSRVSSR